MMTKTFFPFSLAVPFAVLTATVADSQSYPVSTYREVEVRGAEFIPEEDIRLTCGDLTGVELDDLQLRSIEDCLMYTGVFESVAVSSEGDTLVIDVTEVETRPGRIDVGVAWVNDSGLTGTLTYEQFNLIPDTYLGINAGYSEEFSGYGLNIYRKEAFSPVLHFGLDIAGERTRYDDRSFATLRDQSEAYLAFTPKEETRVELGLGYRRNELYDVSLGASPLLSLEAGRISAPFVHVALAFQRDDETDLNGLTIRLDQYFWNLGTDSRVSETRLEASTARSLNEKTSLHFRLLAGLVSGQGGYQTTLLDRGFVGGETLRGFAPRGIGPSDSGDMLGGNQYFSGSVEVQRVLGNVTDSPIRGGVFMDFGSVSSLDNTQAGTIDDSAHLRSSVGMSLTFDVAKVPVSLYIATPINDRPGDKRQIFGLSATARF